MLHLLNYYFIFYIPKIDFWNIISLITNTLFLEEIFFHLSQIPYFWKKYFFTYYKYLIFGRNNFILIFTLFARYYFLFFLNILLLKYCYFILQILYLKNYCYICYFNILYFIFQKLTSEIFFHLSQILDFWKKYFIENCAILFFIFLNILLLKYCYFILQIL